MEEHRFIFVTFKKEGTHFYRDAPDEVAFLRNEHRHVFHFRVDIEVFSDDRDIEFILFKRELESLYDGLLEAHGKSCEMLAEDLRDYLQEEYPGRDLRIEVSEDGENGAIFFFPKQTERTPILYTREQQEFNYE